MQFPTKKPLKKESKLDQNLNMGSAPKRAIRHSWSADRHMKSADRQSLSADWPKLLARPLDSWIEINLTLFDFLEIRTRPNSYLIIQLIFLSIPTSINRGCLSKFNTIFHAFWPPLFLALLFFLILPYVKDILEALALGISFL